MNRTQRRLEKKRISKIKPKIFDFTNYKFSDFKNPDGTSQEGCYASVLQNCSGSLSREHYISENLLARFEKISSKGIPWLSHLGKDLSSNSLTTRCLCQYHNSYLSPLDSLIGDIFDQIRSFSDDKNEITLISGELFERWMLKTLFGLLATGKLTTDNNKFYDLDDIDPIWIEVLYGLKEFPPETGLYVVYNPGDRVEMSHAFQIEPGFIDNKVAGIKVYLGGFLFYLSLYKKDFTFKTNHQNYGSIMHHLKVINKNNGIQKIEFVWNI